jgi:hypothetical protein
MSDQSRIFKSISKMADRRAIGRWSKSVEAAADLDLESLKGLRGRARSLRRRLDQLIHIADGRLALPLIGSNAIHKPLHSDWVYRPELWRGPIFPPGYAGVQTNSQIGGEATIFHDCSISELTFRQIRNTQEEDLAPFGMRMDVFAFDGSFLSVVLDLPYQAVEGLQKRHLFQVNAIVEVEKPLEIFGRLNIKHGPNTEQIVREFSSHSGEMNIEFDLAYTKLNEKRVDRIWFEIIFENPELNQIILRDVTLSRRPRAEV